MRREGQISHRFKYDRNSPSFTCMMSRNVQETRYDDAAALQVSSIGKIRQLGNDQDERVSRCRQYVKAMLQEITFQDTSDTGARVFAAEVRNRCRQMLRNQHPKEGF